MKNYDVYLYGMIVRSNVFMLCNDFPKADSYNEIKEKYIFPGGETGMASTILASLGLSVKMDGNHMGHNTVDILKDYYNKIGVDISSLHFDPDYDGTEDHIIIDKNTRTIFGMFGAYFRDYYEKKIIRWNVPSENDIIGVKAAGIDPFFDKQSLLAAQYCRKHNVPFVTIDEKPDNEVCQLASIIIVSSEYIRDWLPDYYSDDGKINLLKKFAEKTNALVILTGGSGNIYYGRNGEVNISPAYKVETVSTLGAGDTFKAACVYGLSQGWGDEKMVKFASSCAAVACTKFPLAFNPPKLDEVINFMESKK
jgi:sugar/nucleoside kinase (ribokinase family)